MTMTEVKQNTEMTMKEIAKSANTPINTLIEWEKSKLDSDENYDMKLFLDKLIDEGLLEFHSLDYKLDSTTLKAIESSFTGRSAVALKRFAVRSNRRFTVNSLPAVFENTTDIDDCIGKLLDHYDGYCDTVEETIEMFEELSEEYYDLARIENNCVIIDYNYDC